MPELIRDCGARSVFGVCPTPAMPLVARFKATGCGSIVDNPDSLAGLAVGLAFSIVASPRGWGLGCGERDMRETLAWLVTETSAWDRVCSFLASAGGKPVSVSCWGRVLLMVGAVTVAFLLKSRAGKFAADSLTVGAAAEIRGFCIRIGWLEVSIRVVSVLRG